MGLERKRATEPRNPGLTAEDIVNDILDQCLVDEEFRWYLGDAVFGGRLGEVLARGRTEPAAEAL